MTSSLPNRATVVLVHGAWADRPSWHIVSGMHRTFGFALQRGLVRRLKARTTEPKARHMPPRPWPQAASDIMADAVSEVSVGWQPARSVCRLTSQLGRLASH